MPTQHRAPGKTLAAAGAALLAVSLLVAVLAAPAGGATFSNTGPITIPTVGAGTPYPSPISVSGLGGTIVDVNVALNGASHTYPDDVGVLLVGPAGQNVMLMHDVGGSLDISGIALTFDDAAAGSLPDATQITAGTYKPTAGTTAGGGVSGAPPAPAPAGPYGSTLSVFNGTAANGTWNLYVYDDTSGDSGSISGGWTLTITMNVPTVTSFTPTSGPYGTSVVITGTNFTGVTAVTFGGVAATAYTVDSPTQITATVPKGAVTGPIAVTNAAGTGTSASNFTVLSHQRNVSLNLPGSRAKGKVTVPDGFTACAANVPVKVQHLVHGKWKNVASLTTSSSGAFGVGGVSEDGKYRAIAGKVTVGTDVCLKAKSPTISQ